MKKEIIAKVILHTTGNVHIMMSNYLSVYATLENVLELFVDGYSFISSGYEKFETSEKELRGISRSVDLFQGLTLAKVYDDGSIEIIFPTFLEGANDLSLTKLLDRINLSYLRDKKVLKDRKELYLKAYLDFVRPGQNSYVVERNTSASQLNSNESMHEIITFMSKSEDDFVPKEDDSGTTVAASVATKVLTGNMVSLKEYCEFHDLAYPTVVNQVKKGKYASAMKHLGKWYIDKNEPYNPIPLRGRKTKKFTRVSIDTYLDVQNTLLEKGWFSDNIRKYIRNYKEALFYVEQNYKEWSDSCTGKSGLIIDIFPDYYCKELNMTNREMILAGLSPVVPNDYYDDGKPVKYALHHIGMVGADGVADGGESPEVSLSGHMKKQVKKSSPFRIISSKIHNSKEYYSIFHGTPTGNEVHNRTFVNEKKSFWLSYLMEYDEVGSFYKMNYVNIKQKKQDEKNNSKKR